MLRQAVLSIGNRGLKFPKVQAKVQLFKSKILERGVSVFCLYGCLDGCIFISTAIAINVAQETIIQKFEKSNFYEKSDSEESIYEKLDKLSTKVSKWSVIQWSGLEARVGFVPENI